MSQNLTIVAKIDIKKESFEVVKKEVLALVKSSLKDEGCLQYDLYEDNEKPNILVIIESWTAKELWQVHMESKHLKLFVKNTEGLLVDLCIEQLSKI